MTPTPFAYSDRPHVRKHGPCGYTDYTSYKDWLRDEFTFRCVYCLERERWYPSGQAAFSVDHLRPKGMPEYRHLECVHENLAYACNRCNAVKGPLILLDPCAAAFGEHLRVSGDSVEGLTVEGRDMVEILGLDRPSARAVRATYLRIVTLYRQYPDDAEVRALYLQAFGFPDELPDLDSLRPPENTLPEGKQHSYRRRREEGSLPETY